MFQFPACPLLYSSDGSLHPPGYPIRKPVDHSLLAAPYGISSLGTSFLGTLPQGIHQRPCVALNTLYSQQTRLQHNAEPQPPQILAYQKQSNPASLHEDAAAHPASRPTTHAAPLPTRNRRNEHASLEEHKRRGNTYTRHKHTCMRTEALHAQTCASHNNRLTVSSCTELRQKAQPCALPFKRAHLQTRYIRFYKHTLTRSYHLRLLPAAPNTPRP